MLVENVVTDKISTNIRGRAYLIWELNITLCTSWPSIRLCPMAAALQHMGILRVLQQVTLPSFGMMCLNSQLTVHIRSWGLFIFFCHHHHMECFPFSDLRIFSLSIPLCEWLTSTPFLLLVYYLFFCWIFAVALVWCLGTKFHKWLLDFICHHVLHQHSRSCLPDLGA